LPGVRHQTAGLLLHLATTSAHPLQEAIDQIATSIHQFGFINPIIIDNLDTMIAGHGRVEAARSLGLTEVPTTKSSI
jgi:ParB-like chromosome segregation protein Spo0J